MTYTSDFNGHIAVLHRVREMGPDIMNAAQAITDCYRAGGKLIAFGNGGSSSQASHFAGELVNTYLVRNRPGLPAIALNDPVLMSAWANDVGYADVYRRQLQAYYQLGDIVFGISTSGNSENVVEAMQYAREKDARTIGLTAGNGGRMLQYCSLPLVVPTDSTPRAQEMHLLIIHMLCRKIEEDMSGL